MTKIVKEFIIRDGIGAQLCRKLYCMSYAHHKGYLFEDTPITDFFNHPSDNITTLKEKQAFIDNFSSLINNPWADIDFENMENKEYCEEVGFLNEDHQGHLPTLSENFIKYTRLFSNIKYSDNSNIVFHIRRGNVVKENPRWIDESEYVNMFKSLDKIVEKLQIENPKVIILTDASDTDTVEIPEEEINYWRQTFLMKPSDITKTNPPKHFKMTRFDESILDNIKYDVQILKNYDTFQSFLIMCNAKVLFQNKSAFARAAAYLSQSNVIDYSHKPAHALKLDTSLGWYDLGKKEVFFYGV